jgi:alcohol dehydrogenase class IV
MSRLKHGNEHGGLWNAFDKTSQIKYFKEILTKYLYFMTKYDINTIFIDFDKMINDKKYLFDKIRNILYEKNINFDLFSNVYDEVSLTC